MVIYTARIPFLASSCPLLGFRRALTTDNRIIGEPYEFPPTIRHEKAPFHKIQQQVYTPE
jgi:hypothetical protein